MTPRATQRERRSDDDEAAAENVSATAEKGEDLRGKRRRGRHIHDRIFVPGDSVGCSIGAGNFVKKNCRRNRNQFVVFPAICTNDILAALGASLYHIKTSPCMERVWRWCLPIQCHAFLFPVCPPRSRRSPIQGIHPSAPPYIPIMHAALPNTSMTTPPRGCWGHSEDGAEVYGCASADLR